ncbi:hypothetical protein CHS0354_009732 [Potamilus streckersoni]|uniref:Uncharacterized protein n=1 Tax=Potamilus streckersoni TaxID=2493646 RepID=A0AAE0S0X5_9BIVA|nr:hypothetical protein CHS0354_009732 [Potamilus streckersoni]
MFSKLRLSQFAGERLRQENTDITDLADVDRATKLAEAYSELYDNEWTDAFEELKNSGLTENDAIGKLLDILVRRRDDNVC